MHVGVFVLSYPFQVDINFLSYLSIQYLIIPHGGLGSIAVEDIGSVNSVAAVEALYVYRFF